MKPDPLTVLPTARFRRDCAKFVANKFNYLYREPRTGASSAPFRFTTSKTISMPRNWLKLVIAGDILREVSLHPAERDLE